MTYRTMRVTERLLLAAEALGCGLRAIRCSPATEGVHRPPDWGYYTCRAGAAQAVRRAISGRYGATPPPSRATRAARVSKRHRMPAAPLRSRHGFSRGYHVSPCTRAARVSKRHRMPAAPLRSRHGSSRGYHVSPGTPAARVSKRHRTPAAPLRSRHGSTAASECEGSRRSVTGGTWRRVTHPPRAALAVSRRSVTGGQTTSRGLDC